MVLSLSLFLLFGLLQQAIGLQLGGKVSPKVRRAAEEAKRALAKENLYDPHTYRGSLGPKSLVALGKNAVDCFGPAEVDHGQGFVQARRSSKPVVPKAASVVPKAPDLGANTISAIHPRPFYNGFSSNAHGRGQHGTPRPFTISVFPIAQARAGQWHSPLEVSDGLITGLSLKERVLFALSRHSSRFPLVPSRIGGIEVLGRALRLRNPAGAELAERIADGREFTVGDFAPSSMDAPLPEMRVEISASALIGYLRELSRLRGRVVRTLKEDALKILVRVAQPKVDEKMVSGALSSCVGDLSGCSASLRIACVEALGRIFEGKASDAEEAGVLSTLMARLKDGSENMVVHVSAFRTLERVLGDDAASERSLGPYRGVTELETAALTADALGESRDEVKEKLVELVRKNEDCSNEEQIAVLHGLGRIFFKGVDAQPASSAPAEPSEEKPPSTVTPGEERATAPPAPKNRWGGSRRASRNKILDVVETILTEVAQSKKALPLRLAALEALRPMQNDKVLLLAETSLSAAGPGEDDLDDRPHEDPATDFFLRICQDAREPLRFRTAAWTRIPLAHLLDLVVNQNGTTSAALRIFVMKRLRDDLLMDGAGDGPLIEDGKARDAGAREEILRYLEAVQYESAAGDQDAWTEGLRRMDGGLAGQHAWTEGLRVAREGDAWTEGVRVSEAAENILQQLGAEGGKMVTLP